jgi:hypothetical protein
LEINPWSSTDKNFYYMTRFYDDKIRHEKEREGDLEVLEKMNGEETE